MPRRDPRAIGAGGRVPRDLRHRGHPAAAHSGLQDLQGAPLFILPWHEAPLRVYATPGRGDLHLLRRSTFTLHE